MTWLDWFVWQNKDQPNFFRTPKNIRIRNEAVVLRNYSRKEGDLIEQMLGIGKGV